MKVWEKHKGKKINSLRLLRVERHGDKYPGIFLCDCGNETRAEVYRVVKGQVKSCGCRLAKNVSISKIQHGHSTSKKMSSEYNSWRAMKERCLNPNSTGYSDYGGRGVKVCDRWLKFSNFLEDMGRKPTPKHSIERLDNNGNYEPDNCVWATRKAQAANTRKTRFYAYKGKMLTAAQWSEILGINERTIKSRAARGIDLGAPLRKYHAI